MSRYGQICWLEQNVWLSYSLLLMIVVRSLRLLFVLFQTFLILKGCYYPLLY